MKSNPGIRMGCDVSKTVDVIDDQLIEEESTEFTETQIDTIRSTWPLLTRDMTGIGGKVFLRIFFEEPKIKTLFKPFSEMDDYHLMEDQTFREHVTKFMQVVDALVENLDRPKSDIQQLLLMLGAKHATFDGFQIEYFSSYTKALLDVWETTIGEEFIPEVRECWNAVFTYLVRYICQGYELFLSECDKPCNGESHVT